MSEHNFGVGKFSKIDFPKIVLEGPRILLFVPQPRKHLSGRAARVQQARNVQCGDEHDCGGESGGRGGGQNFRSWASERICVTTIPRISLEAIDPTHHDARAARARWLPSRNGGALAVSPRRASDAVVRRGLATLSSAEG